jgi:hypothetical protein
MVAQVVAEDLTEELVVVETLLQLRHHKEIMGLVLQPTLTLVLGVEVAAVLVLLV